MIKECDGPERWIVLGAREIVTGDRLQDSRSALVTLTSDEALTRPDTGRVCGVSAR
jgi:hypothetical protein